jgi:hypothetical protein
MLKKFRDQLVSSGGDGATKSPPFVIRARDLDQNFALCYPLPQDGNSAPYIVVRSSNEGWRLEGAKIFDVCENGKPVRYRVFASKEI